ARRRLVARPARRPPSRCAHGDLVGAPGALGLGAPAGVPPSPGLRRRPHRRRRREPRAPPAGLAGRRGRLRGGRGERPRRLLGRPLGRALVRGRAARPQPVPVRRRRSDRAAPPRADRARARIAVLALPAFALLAATAFLASASLRLRGLAATLLAAYLLAAAEVVGLTLVLSLFHAVAAPGYLVGEAL